MAKKHKHEEHANHERWLVSYADFITLLFATFTALYALSRSDSEKSKAIAESMRISFGAATNSMISKAALDYLGVPSDKPVPQQAARAAIMPGKEAGQGDLEAIKSQLESFLMTQKLLGKVKVEINARGLVISLAEAGFFESGQAEVLPASKPMLEEIAAQLRGFANSLRVEGHTDTLPVHSRTYPSNWELSSARASNVVRLLVNDYHVWPGKISAVGYAEFKPAYSNSTPEGRSRNRRVDIVLLRTGDDGGKSDPASGTRSVESETPSPAPSPWSPPSGETAAPVPIP